MAIQRICVRCGQAPANRIEVSLAMWSVAQDEMPTSASLGEDSCEHHQEEVITILEKHVREMLREQIPIHRQLMALSHERDAAQSLVDEHAPILRSSADDEGVVKEHKKRLAAVAKKEAAHIELQRSGTALSDKRVALMGKELKNELSRGGIPGLGSRKGK